MNKLVLLALLWTGLLFGDDAGLKARMCRDLDTIKGIFETQYAPVEWKEMYAGWILEDRIESAKDQVRNIPDITIKDYQGILHDFFHSADDFHVGISFYSTEASHLPFMLKSAQGRYFIVGLNREGFPECPIEIGDEVLSFDGRPIADVIQEFRNEELKRGDSLSDRAVAERFFTKRHGSKGHKSPEGTVQLGVKHKGEKKETVYTLNWCYHEERVKNISLEPLQACFLSQLMAPVKRKIQNFKKPMLLPHYKLLEASQVETAGEGIGSRNSFVPALGKKIWSAHPDSDFHAYLFETPDKRRFGYVRIPHFDGSTYEFEQFKELIERFEKESEALVIDQLNNPGGAVFYMYSLLSTLSKKALQVPQHRISLTQKEIAFAISALDDFRSVVTDEDAVEVLGDDLDGLPVTMDTVGKLKDYFHFIIGQWNLGINFTSPYPLYGIYEINPNPEVCYTKPILVLINQMDFSCADFFPSILQDNKRATLLGTKTGGAGGFILDASYPNPFGVEEITYTGSIAYRQDNTPIENLGVTPDIEYQLTVDDLTQCYEPYKNKILETLKKKK